MKMSLCLQTYWEHGLFDQFGVVHTVKDGQKDQVTKLPLRTKTDINNRRLGDLQTKSSCLIVNRRDNFTYIQTLLQLDDELADFITLKETGGRENSPWQISPCTSSLFWWWLFCPGIWKKINTKDYIFINHSCNVTHSSAFHSCSSAYWSRPKGIKWEFGSGCFPAHRFVKKNKKKQQTQSPAVPASTTGAGEYWCGHK